MTSPQARKGASFERDVVRYLRDHGHPHVERAYGAGRADDRGDLDGIPGWCFELKNHARLDLAGWTNELHREQGHARASYGCLIVKRRGHPPADAYVVMNLEQFARLLLDVEGT